MMVHCSSSRQSFSVRRNLVVGAAVLLLSHCCLAYDLGDLRPRHLAGLWRLTQSKPEAKPAVYFPMKEFTVYPKDKGRQVQQQNSAAIMETENLQEMLLMLNEDGSFKQYSDGDKAEGQVKIPDKLTYHDSEEAVLDRFFGQIHGSWDYVDGKLILAADRSQNSNEDTMLVGRLVATSEQSLSDNPIVTNATSTMTTKSTIDTHLSVPKGEVKVGKFTYPKTHPSFFDQPMFKPTPKGSFQLKQVLGSLNTKAWKQEDELIEKFRVKDFYGKRFLLTSHPLKERKPKGNTRWSIKYNRFVEDPLSKEAQKAADEEKERPVNIRVMEVKLFANNTFATVAGLGESILRGRYHIIGEQRDQLWMQVWRFGFGRSVSGSVFSEGRGLTSEDEKTYWGTISYEDDSEAENKEADASATADGEDHPQKERRLVVNGSVIFGYGLEPQPVGRFIMTETSETEVDEDEEEDEDDDSDSEGGDFKPPEFGSSGSNDDQVDWSNAFQ